jgi:hypothetical protein
VLLSRSRSGARVRIVKSLLRVGVLFKASRASFSRPADGAVVVRAMSAFAAVPVLMG